MEGRINKEVISTEVKIDKGILTYDGSTIIQLSNVSKISICSVEEEKEDSINWKFISVICICACVVGVLINNITIVAISLFATVVAMIGNALNKKNHTSIRKYLVLALNNGEKVYCYSSNVEFLNKVVGKMIGSLKERSGMTINFEKCTVSDNDFYGSNEGNVMHNKISSGGKQVNTISTGDIIINKETEDWKRATEIFANIMNQQNKNTNEYYFSKLAYDFCKDKDKLKLKQLVERNKSLFDSIVSGTTSSVIVEILKRLIGF